LVLELGVNAEGSELAVELLVLTLTVMPSPSWSRKGTPVVI